VNYFFSGAGGRVDMRARITERISHRLFSCHKEYLPVLRSWAPFMLDGTREWMLDSGAFTAWTRGAIVSLDELKRTYESLLSEYESRTKAVWLINLDVIPGEPGRTAEEDEVKAAIEQSDVNYHQLRASFGERVLPVFHQGEPTARLEEVKEISDGYICLSPRNDVGEKHRAKWAQEMHQHTRGVRTHGLAATGSAMMENSAWHSVDSARWVQQAGFGSVAILLNGKLNMVFMSDQSPQQRKVGGRHFNTFTPGERDAIAARIELAGATVEDVLADASWRGLVNVHETLNWLEQKGAGSSTIQQGLFE
jgi:hypothetical protein